jgi:hypothetical protein
MIALITWGLYLCVASPTTSPPFLTSSLTCSHSLATLSGVSSVIMGDSLITCPLALSSSLTSRPSAWFGPPIMLCAPCYFRLPSPPATESRVTTLPLSSWTSYPLKQLLPPHPTLPSSTPLQPMNTFMFLGALAIPTSLPLFPTSLFLTSVAPNDLLHP